jgi:hypothetical protein
LFHKKSQSTKEVLGLRDRLSDLSQVFCLLKRGVYLLYFKIKEDLAKSECGKLQDSEKNKGGKEEKFHQRNRKLSEVFAKCMSQPSFLYNHMLITFAGVILSGTTFV